MKHKTFNRIYWSIIANLILVFFVWQSFQSLIWKAGDEYGDVYVRAFHVIGIIASFWLVNYLIEAGTRIDENKGNR